MPSRVGLPTQRVGECLLDSLAATTFADYPFIVRLGLACRSSLAATALAVACAQPLNSTVSDDPGGQSNGGRGGAGASNGPGAGGAILPTAGSLGEGGNGGSLAAASGGMDELGGLSGSAGSDETNAGGVDSSSGGTAGNVTGGTAGAIAGSGGTAASGGAAAGTAGAGGIAAGAGAGGTAAGGGDAGGGAGTGGAGGAGCTLSVTYVETRQANEYPLATFTLTNNGAAFPLNQLALRYYFNSELAAGGSWTASLTILQFNNPPASVSAGGSAVVVPNPAAPQGNDSTVVVSFTSTEVFSPARVLTVQFYLIPSSYTIAPDQSNDWSFIQGHTGLWDPPKITLSLNGVQLCGVAP